jgi:transcriptional regulator with XRE-family HTH domain
MPTLTHSERVARNVRAEMVRAAINQTDIASHLGISQQSISRRLSGRTSFTIDELAHIAIVLNVRLADLIGEVAA